MNSVEDGAESSGPVPKLGYAEGSEFTEASAGDAAGMLEPAFAQTAIFWITCFSAVFVGGLCGLACVGYIMGIEQVPLLWSQVGNQGFPDSALSLTYLSGKLWWIGMGAATGLLVGTIKATTHMDTYPSFIVELREREVDPWMSVRVVTLCIISVFGGATVGPEAGLGAMGSLIGQTSARLLQRFKWGQGVDAKELTFAGACAALAPMMPSPIIALILCAEASKQRISSRTAALLFAASTASFGVYSSINPESYLNPMVIEPAIDIAQDISTYDFAVGILFGVLGAGLALSYFLIGAVVKGAFAALHKLLDHRIGTRVRVLVLCTLSGALYGVLGYIFPLTLGTGEAQLRSVVQLGPQLSSGLLVSSAFAKMLTYWICASGGLVGGIIMPIFLTGTMMGSAVSQWTGTNYAVALACATPSLAAAFVPFPQFWIWLIFLTFMLGVKLLFPIYASVFTAYIIFVGLGVPHALLALRDRKKP